MKYLWKAVEDGRGENKDTGLAEKAVAEVVVEIFSFTKYFYRYVTILVGFTSPPS